MDCSFSCRASLEHPFFCTHYKSSRVIQPLCRYSHWCTCPGSHCSPVAGPEEKHPTPPTCPPLYSHLSPHHLPDSRGCPSLQTEILGIIITVTASKEDPTKNKGLVLLDPAHLMCLKEVSLSVNTLIEFLVLQTPRGITIKPLRNYMERKMTRPCRNCLVLSSSLINLSTA